MELSTSAFRACSFDAADGTLTHTLAFEGGTLSLPQSLTGLRCGGAVRPWTHIYGRGNRVKFASIFTDTGPGVCQ